MTCPDCGSLLQRLWGPDGWRVVLTVGHLGRWTQETRRLAVIYACTGCEFVIGQP
jgi:predicted RNA-binding Zn-ribbon protein involved in translation (DUF1610 family)